MSDTVEPLSYQKVGLTGQITLRMNVLEAFGAKPGDWVVLLPGKPGSDTIIIKRGEPVKYNYDEIG